MQTLTSIPDQATVKSLIDTHIKAYCAERRQQALEVGERYEMLWRNIEHLLLAGGKRFRPYMLITSYLAYNPKADITDVIPAAVAHELLHSAMLIHDDIIDRDTVRYGVKNVAGQYAEAYASLTSDHATREHFSLSMALLAGDALLSDAHRLLRSTSCPEEYVERAGDILAQGIFEVIGGELLDTEAAILPKGLIAAEKVALHKTASYSFVSPLTSGAVLAGAPMSQVQLLRDLSESLGLGYQLRDDLIGIFGDADKTGKSTSTDITEGKRTFIVEQFDTLASTEQKEAFYRIFHRSDATEQEIDAAKALLIESGAEQSVEARIEHLRQDAEALVERLDVSEEAKQTFRSLIAHCLERTA